MKAAWRVARAAVRRRRLQTIVIGVVVAVSTGTMVLALGLLVSSTAPLDKAHAAQRGPDLVVSFDNNLVSNAQLSTGADQPAVQAVAGPFGQVDLGTSAGRYRSLGALTTVGRADPAGPVDRLNVWQGRWATKPGEIVLNVVPGTSAFVQDDPVQVGTQLALPGRPVLTVVGFAYSVSQAADAWVTPGQLADLRPTATQMLYRFTNAATPADVSAGQAAVTAGLPPKAVLGAQSYFTIKEQLTSQTQLFVPFLSVFGILGLIVSILIVANVVSGAVVSGFRNIGVLKSLGFTPNQVMGVYLLIVTVPAVIGCVVGTVLGNIVARPLLSDAFSIFGTTDIGIDLWVSVVALLGMPILVGLAALVSALRARGLPAAQAISAGSAQRVGRALAVQRWLSGTRLPRSVSLGLGVPLARPARSALTLAAIVLGVTTVTLAIGVTLSINAYGAALRPTYPDRLEFLAGLPGDRPALPGQGEPVAPTLSDAGDQSMLRSIPGAVAVAAVSEQDVHAVGWPQRTGVEFYRGDSASLGPQVERGQWPDRAGEVAVPSRFLNQRGLALGDTITIELDTKRTQVRIVGVVLVNNADTIFADWQTLTLLAPTVRADTYEVQLKAGTDQQAYERRVQSADPGLQLLPPRDGTSDQAVVLISSATLLTLLLGVVSALGVFNTVVLNARERRRDLGMLKSIGMTPRQVTLMMVTSMGALGVLGGVLGVPLGVAVHGVVAPAMLRAGQSDVFDFVLDVYRAPMLLVLGLAGIVIAVLGALLPARSAARVPIAQVLHNE
jgi:putative ABC transport system permease protein